jgi:Fic family protein
MASAPTWNWQQPEWPRFEYDPAQLAGFEAEFQKQSGIFIGSIKHAAQADEEQLRVELLSDEALQTSEIEGEILNRDSVQSSIRRNFGIATDDRRIPAAEQGISEMMVDLYRGYSQPLTDELLFRWHGMLMNGRRDLKEIGAYRTGAQPMQVVSGPIHAPEVHFEAPPSGAVPSEMAAFTAWFNQTGPGGKGRLPTLIRSGLAHLYFVCIHPFEDGNGRVGRAIAEMALAQGQGRASLISLSSVINSSRRNYYEMLEASNRHCTVTDWLIYFSKTVLAAQEHTQQMVDFLIAKTRFHDRLRGQLNSRQEKAIVRMLREGPKGFKGGLSAENYMRITGATRASTTRDLHDLVMKGALIRTGNFKSTRYSLAIGNEMEG